VSPEILTQRLRTEHLTLLAYRVLLEIEVTPETMKHIAGVVKTTPQNLTHVVKGLEKRELVGRVPEGKFVNVGITEKGKELLGRIEKE